MAEGEWSLAAVHDVLADAIVAKWGSVADFKAAFQASAVGNFGSGWTWLVAKPDGTVDIVNTGAAGTPLTTDAIDGLVSLDVELNAQGLEAWLDRDRRG